MILLRPSNERGGADHGWLQTRHTFSFADYHDPAHHHFQALRVINEDWIAPGSGFGTHPHRDMEILTWVLAGAVRHEDSQGNVAVIEPGMIQRMSAGRGILHSEHNASSERTHMLQIWITPRERGLEPSYEEWVVPTDHLQGRFGLLAGPDPEEIGVTIHQDARLLGARLTPAAEAAYDFAPGRHGWLQVARGAVEVEGAGRMAAGDGAAVSEVSALRVRATEEAEVLLFDLAPFTGRG